MTDFDWSTILELARPVVAGEESVVTFPYDDRRQGKLRRIGRDEVERDGFRYRVTATDGTATIGYGDTDPDLIDRYWDRDMTQDEARESFDRRAEGYWREGVLRHLTRPLPSPWMHVALLSFAWNAGVNALPRGDGPIGYRAPGLLRALNEGRWQDAAEALKASFTKQPAWDLRPRREREAAIFLKETEMQTWHPRARHLEPVNTSPVPFRGNYPYRIVLHTTEGGRNGGGASNYHGHQSYPHFECHEDGFDQYFPLDTGSRALARANAVETNAARAVQIEIVGRAANAQNFSDRLLANLADICNWVMEQAGVQPLPPPQGFYNGGHSNFFSPAAWREWNGFCGHVNVPENTERWDPGDFPWERFSALLTEGDDMFSDEDRELLKQALERSSYAVAIMEEFKKAFRTDTEAAGKFYDPVVGTLAKKMKSAKDASS